MTFTLSSAEWEKINRYTRLPESAVKVEIEALVGNYRRFEAVSVPPPYKIKKELEDASAQAKHLERLILKMSEDATSALLSLASNSGSLTPKNDALQLLMKKAQDAGSFSDWCEKAISSLSSKKSGPDRANLDWLVRGAAYIYNVHTISSLFDGSKECKNYIFAIVHVANPAWGNGSIETAIRSALRDPKIPHQKQQ